MLPDRTPPEPLAAPPPLPFAVVPAGAFDAGTVVFRARGVGLADCFRFSFAFALGELLAVVLGVAEAEASGAALPAGSPAPGVLSVLFATTRSDASPSSPLTTATVIPTLAIAATAPMASARPRVFGPPRGRAWKRDERVARREPMQDTSVCRSADSAPCPVAAIAATGPVGGVREPKTRPGQRHAFEGHLQEALREPPKSAEERLEASRPVTRQPGLHRPLNQDTIYWYKPSRSGAAASPAWPAELAIALLWVEEKKAQGIVAPSLDRLAREPVVQEAAPAQCRQHGGGRTWVARRRQPSWGHRRRPLSPCGRTVPGAAGLREGEATGVGARSRWPGRSRGLSVPLRDALG